MVITATLGKDMDSGTQAADITRRFASLERLYGPQVSVLEQAHVAVAGIGGVGSWCAEALARSGLGKLTLIDMDHVSESNINRQLHALSHTVGQAKIEAMAERVRAINPYCSLSLIDDFVSADNVGQLLAPDLTVLIDCTDQASAKIAMILEARARGLALIVCGAAGGKTRVLSLRAGDLADAQNDALLARLRNTLRRHHGYPKAGAQGGKAARRAPRMRVKALWFDQPAVLPQEWQNPAAPDATGLQGLSCAGYGSVVTITASMGMAAAAEAIEWVFERYRSAARSD